MNSLQQLELHRKGGRPVEAMFASSVVYLLHLCTVYQYTIQLVLLYGYETRF